MKNNCADLCRKVFQAGRSDGKLLEVFTTAELELTLLKEEEETAFLIVGNARWDDFCLLNNQSGMRFGQ